MWKKFYFSFKTSSLTFQRENFWQKDFIFLLIKMREREGEKYSESERE
jgi:hypothetical protein